jgi:hypothetical protein
LGLAHEFLEIGGAGGVGGGTKAGAGRRFAFGILAVTRQE